MFTKPSQKQKGASVTVLLVMVAMLLVGGLLVWIVWTPTITNEQISEGVDSHRVADTGEIANLDRLEWSDSVVGLAWERKYDCTDVSGEKFCISSWLEGKYGHGLGAVEYCRHLDDNGGRWRLPTTSELQAGAKSGIIDIGSGVYWSGQQKDDHLAYNVNVNELEFVDEELYSNKAGSAAVRCVRSR